MDFELRRRALASIDKFVREVQVVVITFTRELTFKVAKELNTDAGEMKCLPCVNDRTYEEHLNELISRNYPIVASTLGRADLLFLRNAIKPICLKELFILDSTAMINFPIKRQLEKLLGFMQRHVHITLHLPPKAVVVRQIRDFIGNVTCYEVHTGLIEANHFALHVLNERRKMDALCELCQISTSAPMLVCCSSDKAVFSNAKLLRSKNLPVITVTRKLASEDINTAIKTFMSGKVHVMLASGYIRGLIDVKTPMFIVNYDLPKPDAYARRVNFTGEFWIASRTVFISLVKMFERPQLLHLKKQLGLRWILEMYSI